MLYHSPLAMDLTLEGGKGYRQEGSVEHNLPGISVPGDFQPWSVLRERCRCEPLAVKRGASRKISLVQQNMEIRVGHQEHLLQVSRYLLCASDFTNKHHLIRWCTRDNLNQVARELLCTSLCKYEFSNISLVARICEWSIYITEICKWNNSGPHPSELVVKLSPVAHLVGSVTEVSDS